MPGENCSIFGCGTNRRHKGKSIFKIPLGTDEFNKEWGRKLINILVRDRNVEKEPKLKEKILMYKKNQESKLYICQDHFKPHQYWVYPTKKELKPGELPTEKLPEKSIVSQPIIPRSTSTISKRENHQMQLSLAAAQAPPPKVYKDFDDFKCRVAKLSLNWTLEINDDLVVGKKYVDGYVLPKYEIYVGNDLIYIIRMYGWVIPESNNLYVDYSKSLDNISLSNLIKHIEQLVICEGIKTPDPVKLSNCQIHVISKTFNYNLFQTQKELKVWQDDYFRSKKCMILLKNNGSSLNVCHECHSHNVTITANAVRKKTVTNNPAKLNAPIKFTSPDRVKLTLQESRLKCKQLEGEIEKMKVALESYGEKVSDELNKDFVTIFSGADKRNVPDFMKLFWEEQQKYINSSSASSVRYHPMVIKYCLNLAAKSSAAYDELRYDSKTGSGILVLPSKRTLRDYRNYIKPMRGFNPAVIKELGNKISNFQEMEKFVAILLDEMKIQDDLVWDKYTGELIGFVDLGDIEINFATLHDVTKLATHVLVFLVKSIANKLSYSFATFATTGVSSFQIMVLFWKCVCYLEQMGLKVISCTADGASPNRKFFRMHHRLEGNSGKGVVYRSKNLHAKEDRFIFFFSDVPHLMKTARNGLANSGAGKGTQYMWNNGFHILWGHISQLYYDDLESGLKLANKLTSDHINLTAYSVMRVRLAVQVLSETVGRVLEEFGPPEASGTAKFCLQMDKFFDCLNVRNTKEHHQRLKPNLKPYDDILDERFELLDNFLQYFENWLKSIESRDGEYSEADKAKMFIPWQTWEGIQVTVHSFKEVCKYLLQNGVKYVLSEKFCQDDLENYFGRQRAIGARKDNPTVRDVGYNDNTIKSQFSVRPISGNVQSSSKFNIIDDTPVPKRKRVTYD